MDMLTGAAPVAPIFLRGMDVIDSCCGQQRHDAVGLPVEDLEANLETLTALLQFSCLLARAHPAICLSPSLPPSLHLSSSD